MNLRKKLISMSALAIIASLMFGAASAQLVVVQDASIGGEVEIVSAGEFTVSICNVEETVNFGTVGVSTIASDKGSASLYICFVDTHTDRAAWVTQLSANDFTFGSQVIPVTGLNPTLMYGSLVGQMYPAYTQGGWYHTDYGTGQLSPSTTQPLATTTWTGGNTGLGLAKQVGHGDEGRGHTFIAQRIDLELVVPANTLPGTYTSVITVDILGSGL